MVYPALVSALIVMLASLAGIIFASRRLESWVDRHLPLLVSFSVGVLGVSTYGLFVEGIEHTSLLIVLVAALGGFAFVQIASLLLPDAHHHHEASEVHPHSPIDARRILAGDAVHNVTDGLLLVPAFLVDIRVGIATTVGVFLHELVQEISEFFILRRAGYSTRQALVRNFIVSGSILIGVALSFMLTSIESIEPVLIAFAAGGFLFILIRDLVPSTVASMKKATNKRPYIVAIVLGIIAMSAVGVLAPHSHGEEDGHDDELSQSHVSETA